MNILVAEDDMIFRRLLEAALTGWGYRVTLARDGNEAWRALQSTDRPQLAILDWMMPGLEGIEVCRRLRASEGGMYVYVLLLTAKERKQDLVEGLRAGADDFLSKPFDHVELEARLRTGRRIVELEQRLTFQALHDPLTGAMNRAGVLDSLRRDVARSMRDGAPVSVIMADLDHFKAVNDSRGHAAGDSVLVEATRRFRAAVRPHDIVARWGGEEFLMVLPACAREDAMSAAERIREAIAEQPFEVGGAPIPLTVSLGVSTGRDAHESLVQGADAALYAAKEGGRDRVAYAAPGSRHGDAGRGRAD